ncbi:ATP-binding cassette domain-containing protein [Microbacterium sp. RU33B]|uniref:ATP-binding cassette domain-containing protein n=1 Tax=Microbacterium sp. RU33B TaxID=1907390 RepID=UPI0009604791|nr:ATP-binding cassette domain-containing protein [Microbacterium sp. RU33B]SIT67972.1 energy-coupling factor transport system ATP-binding protein [Microbacterium sp. RU33B]
MSFRPGPLRAAAALAVGFVGVRVVYRVVFHGAEGSGPVLWDLPVVRLPDPFGHVAMFGPATLDGVAAAAWSAVPIAATILVFGLLNAVFDISRLFARGARRGPFRGIARALVIAWATLPALADAVRAVRFARRLRGERGGVRLLSPVLERTLERATAVAAALELRGFAGRALEGDCAHPVEIRDAALGHGGTGIVRVPELVLGSGSLTVLSGPTGSGKSTVLRAISGLLVHVDGGTSSGAVRVVGRDRDSVPPRDTARTVGVVLQNPREALATETVFDEIGLALELRGVAPVLRDARVRDVAERIGISGLLERRIRELSAGEATLVAIAAAVVDEPILVVIDEPLADLDASYRGRIVALLGELAHEGGMCVVVAEHRPAEFAAVADAWFSVVDGAVRVAVAPAAAAPTSPSIVGFGGPISRDTPEPTPCVRSSVPAALQTRGLTVRHGDKSVVRDASLAIAPGEIVAVGGPNGAGKSSLLAAIALPTGDAEITVDGAPIARGAVSLVPDASDDLFVCDTVAAECRRADRRAATDDAAARFAGLLSLAPESAPFADLLRRHPRDLSVGQRRCLAIALQTLARPRVLLVDEPTRGLDPEASALVAAALRRHAASGGAVLIATHDADVIAAIADRVVPMADGCLGEPLLVRTPDARDVPHRRVDDRPAALRPTIGAPLPGPDVVTGGAARGARRALAGRGILPLLFANLAAASAFLWPLVASALPTQAQGAVPYVALALAPLAVLVALSLLDGTVRSAHSLALLGTLAAIGAAIRIVGTGVGGVEALFILLILAGRAFGPRFGLLLGALSIAISAVVAGGIGPWTPFQMFACGWVAAGAGLLPRRVRGWAEIGMLCLYDVLASYAFGLIMNMWFWPFAVGTGTGISYVPGAPVAENLGSFLIYSLVTSTATWDTLRAVTTVIGLVVVGRPILRALRRAKPVTPSTHPNGGDAPGAASATRRVAHDLRRERHTSSM